MIPGHLLLSHTLFICEDFNYNLLNQFTSKFKKIGFKHIFTTAFRTTPSEEWEREREKERKQAQNLYIAAHFENVLNALNVLIVPND